MPFTVSHAAAVLPFRSRYLSASALVIGAMIPDLPLYLPLPFAMDTTHTVLAAVTLNVVLGLAVFVVWHGFFARPADWFAPSAIRKRLSPTQQPGLRRRMDSPAKVAGVLASLLIGQATHFFFDLFTHPGTVITDNVAVFQVEVAGVPVHFLAQVGLSVLGLVLIALWAVRWFRTSPTYPLERQPSRLGKLAARGTVLGGAAAALLLTGAAATGASAKYAMVHMSVAAVVAAGLASVVVASVWHLRNS